jgi:phosphoglycerate dehydrogenase-like enzyme
MHDCLIICNSAERFAHEIERLASDAISFKECRSAEEALKRYDGEEVLFGDPSMIATILEDLPGVRWVQSTWAGVKPLIDASRRDYVLTGVKDVFGPQMAEYVMGYLLSHELRIIERLEAQRARRWDATYSGTLAGKCLGVMGTGSIGDYIARKAKGFDIRTLGLSLSGRPSHAFDAVYPADRLLEFLPHCDYLVSTLPQTPATDALLNAQALAALPAGACFINVGRSNVVDDGDLLDALKSGHLARAVLDVVDEEPVPPESELWDAPNLTITAHIAAVSHPELIVPIFVRNFAHFRKAEPLEYVVDFSAGY